MKLNAQTIRKTIIILSVLMIAGSLAFLIPPHSSIKSILDTIPADGSLEMYTTAVHNSLRFAAILILIFSITILAGAALLTNRFEAFLHWIHSLLSKTSNQLKEDFKSFWRSSANNLPEGKELYILLGITLIGIILRLLLINRPMTHDETYTFIGFASRDLLAIVTDYHLPNNHIFHSILVHFSTNLLGPSPWAIRLPAFLAGVLTIPVGFILSRRVFREKTGWFITFAIAVLPNFLLLSVDGRGYSLQVLITLLLWLLGIYLKENRNSFGWLLMVVLATAGFYTLPTTLYPFGMILGWLFFSWIVKDHSSAYSRKQFFSAIFLTGLGVSLLTILLYIPIILNNGLEALVGNRFIEAETLNTTSLLIEQIIFRGTRTWQDWSRGIGDWFAILTAVMLIVTILFSSRLSKQKVHLLIPGLLWILALVFIQQLMPWRRILSFLSPIYFLYSFGLMELLIDKVIRSGLLRNLLLTGFSIVFLTFSIHWEIDVYEMPKIIAGTSGAVEAASEFLAENIAENDFIADAHADGPMFRYYTIYKFGMEKYHWNKTEVPFERVFVIIKPAQNQTIEDNLALRAPELLPWYNQENTQLVYEYSGIEIYLVDLLPELP